MDPVSTAIIAALVAGAARGIDGTAGQLVTDAYAALKNVIVRKFGKDSEAAQAIDRLEDRPESTGRRTSLEEEITESPVVEDADVLAAAQALLDRVKALPEGGQVIQFAIGSTIAQATHGGNATVVHYRPDPP